MKVHSFKLIPLDHLLINTRNSVHFVNNVKNIFIHNKEYFNDKQYIRGIYSKSYTSNVILPPSMYNTKLPWYMNTKHCMYTHVTFGKQYIDTYHPETKEKTSIIMTDNIVCVNGIKVMDIPCMLMLPPGLLYRTIIGNKGSSSMIVNTVFNELCEKSNDDTDKDNDKDNDKDKDTTDIKIKYDYEAENELKVVKICPDTGKTINLDEYHDHEIENSNSKTKEWNKLVNKWNQTGILI